MPAGSSSWTPARILVGLLALGLGACQAPGATRIVGPDGSPMAHVHCGQEQGTCFRLAGELCPSGYEMRPVLSGNDGNFLIRCRAASATAAPPACPPSVATLPLPASSTRKGSALSAASVPPPQSWPPSGEPSPATNPWTPPETNAGVVPVAPDNPRTEPWDPGF